MKSAQCATVDHLLTLILKRTRGLSGKSNIKEAYRIIPVHPYDQPLLGVE